MRIQLRIERPLDRPIVRQAQEAPFGIVEGEIFGAGSFTLEEAPIRVEIDAADAVNGNGGSCGERFGQTKGDKDATSGRHRGATELYCQREQR